MKAIAIINLKGGVGKTVTAINVAAILARDYGKRVLVVDADSQHNTTDFFGVGAPDNNLSVFLRAEGEDLYTCYIQKTDIEGLDVLPGDDGLMDLDISHIRDGRVRGDILRDLITCIVADDEYDYVIYDCPPAFNAASTAALAASTDAVIPIKLDAFSLSGLNNMLHQIAAMHRINPRLRVAGCLITMWSKADADAEKKLRGVNAKVLPTFQTVIRRSDKVNAMTFSGEPLTIYSPRSAAGVDYRRFVEEYLGGELRG